MGEVKASRGANVLEQGHKVGPSTFIFTVNIFYLDLPRRCG